MVCDNVMSTLRSEHPPDYDEGHNDLCSCALSKQSLAPQDGLE